MTCSINEMQDRIIEELNAYPEWFDKYQYLVEQGKHLAELRDSFRVEANLIPGCQSRVWLHAEIKEGKLSFEADCDALITKGLVALLLRVLNGRPPGEVLDADLFFIERTGLRSNLSPSRANGLASIVLQLKRHAERALR